MPPKHLSAEERAERASLAVRIGQRVRSIRLERGMTQSDLAGDRYTKAYVSAIETGIARPSMAALHFLAERLRVVPDLLIQPGAAGETVALPGSIVRVRIADGRVYVELDDGREVGIPLQRSTRLRQATLEQLDDWRVTDYGRAVSWPAVDEEIGLEAFLGTRVLEDRELRELDGTDEVRRREPGRRGRRASRYLALTPWLRDNAKDELTLTFARVEEIMGHPLPPSARRYGAPWSSTVNPLAKAIHEAGWRASVRLKKQQVALRRS